MFGTLKVLRFNEGGRGVFLSDDLRGIIIDPIQKTWGWAEKGEKPYLRIDRDVRTTRNPEDVEIDFDAPAMVLNPRDPAARAAMRCLELELTAGLSSH